MSPAQTLSLSPARRSRVRVVTAASLFDGHDAAINIMRRILQSQGAEVIHLGHDRSVDEIVQAAVQEDASAVAVSSYQGGHMEFFRYLKARLRERGAAHIRVYGGGGGTITPEEMATLRDEGIARIFGPAEGRQLGLDGMIREIMDACSGLEVTVEAEDLLGLAVDRTETIARLISWLEEAGGQATQREELSALRGRLDDLAKHRHAPVVGFTGTGGAGKSSVVDELVRRFRDDFPAAAIGLILVDPSRRRTGGALLGDRIRMNAIHGGRVFARSMATRQAHRALSQSIRDALRVMQAAHFDLIFVETAGIGQGDSEIVDLVDVSLYVMTPEYGAPSQLEKIDMVDLADLVVLNKFDRHGAADALRDVRKQWRRNRTRFDLADPEVPVFPAVARNWNDPGISRLYEALRIGVVAAGGAPFERGAREVKGDLKAEPPIALSRTRYLAEIAATVRGYRAETERQAETAARADGIARALRALGDSPPAAACAYPSDAPGVEGPEAAARVALRARYQTEISALDPALRQALADWSETRQRYAAERQEYEIRGRPIVVENHTRTLSDTSLPKVALPRTRDWGELSRYLRLENLPGHFPFTAGVFPFKRANEDPARMFAGEGGPEATNRRFHLLAEGQPASRLSTAFDSVTLYGRDPDRRPDIYGRVGNSGVSICTLDDTKKLYSGFDLCDPKTSVSLTINGPAPTVLAFFLNAAIDQQVEKHLLETGKLAAVRERVGATAEYRGELPPGHSGLGLGLLGIPGDCAVDAEIYARIKADALARVRGTVQADILKEDQAQNTCIFSTEFSLKVMGDIQAHFIENHIRNFYSVSISGYHIAEAGANPITQLAFTLANGFTYCEHYLSRGMAIDDFAANFSFFFSNGLDAEYNAMGRVARRIWAVALRERYGAAERSQKLKYHIQTSGRSLHAQEMNFNDIRTTLQALTALQDQCNSLHTNAYDEAVTTPTEDSVRRALAIQLVINKEFGSAKNENPIQGAYWIDELTDQLEEAVLCEFERISARGGVLGAMETHYQRAKIQDESLHYESLKHSGELPLIGVNTFLNPRGGEEVAAGGELIRSSDADKQAQLDSLAAFRGHWAGEAPDALQKLRDVATAGDNVFAELMETVKRASLGQISDALFEAGGRYRRSM